MKNFADALIEASKAKNSHLIAGLDPVVKNFPAFLTKENMTAEESGEAIFKFNRMVIDAVHEHVVAVKPQLAFYEVYGSVGIKALEDTIAYAKSKNLLVINDGKRNDIGSTCEGYADAHLGKGKMSADALTVTPYLGSDGITPFIKRAKENNKGFFVLVKTSNPSSNDFQNLMTENGKELYMEVAEKVIEWSEDTYGDSGYSFVGVVAGATYPEEAKKLRKLLPKTIFLVPGYGAQGADVKGLLNFFNSDKQGAVVNSSRGILYPYKDKNITEKGAFDVIRQAAINSQNEINSIF